MQYAFFSAEEMIWEYGNGFADVSTRERLSTAHTFNAYSITKTITALAVLELAMKGKLKVSDPVRKYLTSLPYPRDISVLQLLTHSAGIPNPLPLNWIHLTSEHAGFDSHLFFEKIFAKHSKTKGRPNEKFSYSNLGYVILGQLIEQIAGISYEQFTRENVFSRINATEQEMGFTHRTDAKHCRGYQKRWSFINLILGFFIDKSKFTGDPVNEWLPFNFFYVNGTSYGGLIASFNGLVKYVRAFLLQENPFLSKQYTDLLFAANRTNNGHLTGMSCSWFSGRIKGYNYFCHAGGGGGFYCEIRIYPSIRKGSVVFFNRTGMSDERFLDKADQFFLK